MQLPTIVTVATCALGTALASRRLPDESRRLPPRADDSRRLDSRSGTWTNSMGDEVATGSFSALFGGGMVAVEQEHQARWTHDLMPYCAEPGGKVAIGVRGLPYTLVMTLGNMCSAGQDPFSIGTDLDGFDLAYAGLGLDVVENHLCKDANVDWQLKLGGTYKVCFVPAKYH